MRRLINTLKLSEKTCLGLLLFTIFIVSSVFCFVGLWLLQNYLKWVIVILIGLISLFGLVEFLYSKYPSRGLGGIRYLIKIPLAIFGLILHGGVPFIMIVFTYFPVFVLAFCFPFIIIKVLSVLGGVTFQLETIIFISLSTGSILCSYSHGFRLLMKWVLAYNPFTNNKGFSSSESFKVELAYYLVRRSNIIFLLYFLYFLFLCISGFLQIEKGDYLISMKIDAVILKAFLVFIAFSNMRTKLKEADANVKDLLQHLLNLFVHKD
jgi:hypothetical protein